MQRPDLTDLARARARGPRLGAQTAILRIEAMDQTVVITVSGTLDGEGGRLVHEAVEAACATAHRGQQIELDLGQVTGTTASGIRALAACAGLGETTPARLRFRVGNDSRST